MQDYTYSVFSLVAIAIHLIININLLVGRGVATVRGMRYRGFLTGILTNYISDAASPDPAESRGAPAPPQDPSPLRGTPGSSLQREKLM